MIGTKFMKQIKAIISEIGKILGIGLISAAGIALILLIIGAGFGRRDLSEGIETAKNGMLIISSSGLFLLAGMLMTNGKKDTQWIPHESWKKHFHIIGYKTAVTAVSIAFMLASFGLDYIQLYGI